MVSKQVVKEIDKTIKEIWLNNIRKDWNNDYLLREDSLKCCLYYHLRTKLKKLLKENNLRIYSEYYVEKLKYRADIAIVELDLESEDSKLKNRVKNIVAIFELKYVSGNAVETEETVKQDIRKIKDYIQIGDMKCQYYFTVIYETLCSSLNWFGKNQTNNWANGYVTELDAGYKEDGYMWFEVHSYNGINKEYSEKNDI